MCKIDNNHYNTAIRPKTVLFGDVIAIVEETPEVLIETIADHNGEPQEAELWYTPADIKRNIIKEGTPPLVLVYAKIYKR